MKKETAIFGFIAVAAVAFIAGRMTAPKAGDETTKTVSAKNTTKANAPATNTDSKDGALPIGTSYFKGEKNALVTIIEFSEFQCPFCSRVLPTVKKIMDTYKGKVRVVFKHNPLPFHKNAPLASEAAMAAGAQGKFWPYHDKLFANQKALERPQLEKYAQEIGLDVGKFKTALDKGTFKKAVEADKALAAKVGARGTPNFFVNGVQLTGAQPFDKFKTVIDAQLKAAEALQKQGKKAGEIYQAMVAKNFKAPAARPDRKRAEDKSIYKVPVGASPFKGEKDALVTIIEFSEFQCPFCSRVLPTVKKVMDAFKGKVKVVFKHNPLPFHKDAPLASEAAMAANAQGKFWPYHDKLFANQKAIKRPDLEKYAQELGLDMAKFKAALDGGTYKKAVAADQALAKQFGARGTPNFFINGRKLVGAQPFDKFKTVIEQEIKKAEKLVAAGTPKSGLYRKLTAKGLTKAAAPPSRARPDDKAVYKVPVAADEPAKGPADALVTIVEFSDFQCPFCSRVNPTIKQVMQKYGKDVRVVFKHNPLPFHKNAPLAAEAAMAANDQGKFWPYHDKLFANQKALNRPDLEKYAAEIGLDVGKFKAALDSGKFKKKIQGDQALARQLGAGGTPNFFINGRKLTGAQPFPSFQKLIDEELKKAKALVAKGTPRSGVYAELIKKGATKAAAPTRRPPEDDKKIYDVKVGPNDAFKGNAKAPVTIIAFSDFQCPFCSRVNPTIKQVEETYKGKVKIVFKHNPLSFHKDAPLAAEAALAAHEQGKFWPYHDVLFKNQRALKRPDLEKYAQELGLNMDKFKAALDSHKFKPQIDNNVAEARAVGATGTPSFFINGRKLRGARPFPDFKRVIDEELAKKK